MVDFTSAAVTTLIGMMGVVVGAIVSNYVNQRVAARSARLDLIFKRKIDYFDRTVGVIEHNLRLYTVWIRKLGIRCTHSEVERALKHLKKKRRHFEISTSALYLDVNAFTRDVKIYVAIEKRIFTAFEAFEEGQEEKTMEMLRNSLRQLSLVGNDIIRKMRNELGSE